MATLRLSCSIPLPQSLVTTLSLCNSRRFYFIFFSWVILCGFALWCLVYFIPIAQKWVPSFWINHIPFMDYTTFLCYIMHWWTSFLLDNMTSINVGVVKCFSVQITDSSFLHPTVELLSNMLDKLLVLKEILPLLYKACILTHFPINMNEVSSFC
jgi:hypothetical protein